MSVFGWPLVVRLYINLGPVRGLNNEIWAGNRHEDLSDPITQVALQLSWMEALIQFTNPRPAAVF